MPHSPGLSVPSKVAIFIVALLEFLPQKLIALFMDNAPFKFLQNARRVGRLAVEVAKGLVEEKAEALIAGKGKRDIMSLLGSWQEFICMSHGDWNADCDVPSQGQWFRRSPHEPQRDRDVRADAVSFFFPSLHSGSKCLMMSCLQNHNASRPCTSGSYEFVLFC
jgi:hypothetical protein